MPNKLWMQNYEKLKEFHKSFHHCNVTKHDDPLLGRWVARQRGERNEFLDTEQRKLLDSMGFEWDVKRTTNQEVLWETNCSRLQSFLKKGNTFHIPDITKHDEKLGTWALNQRKRHQMGKLRENRFQKLQEIGFEFGKKRTSKTSSNKCATLKIGKAREAKWNAMFDRLLEFRKEHGHVCVPYHYPDRSLALWVTTQRREFHAKSWLGNQRSIREERKERLNSIGFVWDNIHRKGPKPKKNNKNKKKNESKEDDDDDDDDDDELYSPTKKVTEDLDQEQDQNQHKRKRMKNAMTRRQKKLRAAEAEESEPVPVVTV